MQLRIPRYKAVAENTTGATLGHTDGAKAGRPFKCERVHYDRQEGKRRGPGGHPLVIRFTSAVAEHAATGATLEQTTHTTSRQGKRGF